MGTSTLDTTSHLVHTGLTLTLAERNPRHLALGVMAALCLLVNLNHAGVRFLGHHPKGTRHGRNVGIVFAPSWGTPRQISRGP